VNQRPIYPFFLCMCDQAFAQRGLQGGFPFSTVYIDFRNLAGLSLLGHTNAWADIEGWTIVVDNTLNGYGDPRFMQSNVRTFWSGLIAHEMYHFWDFYVHALLPARAESTGGNVWAQAFVDHEGTKQAWVKEHWLRWRLINWGLLSDRSKGWEEPAWDMQDYVVGNYAAVSRGCTP
jgi:hypothetical protein